MCAGDIQSVHYDKRGAKITIAFEGDDCGGKKDEIEQAANKFCADNATMASVRLDTLCENDISPASAQAAFVFGLKCF